MAQEGGREEGSGGGEAKKLCYNTSFFFLLVFGLNFFSFVLLFTKNSDRADWCFFLFWLTSCP